MDQTATAPRVRIFDRKKLEARDHWLRALGREIALAGPLPDAAPPRADAASAAGAADAPTGEVAFAVGDEARAALDRLSRGSPFLSYVALTAALHVALYRYAALDLPATIAVGTPPRLGDDGSAPAPNLLPVVAGVDPAAPFRDLLAEVRRALLEAQARQDYPFAQMLRDQGDGARLGALRAATLSVDGVSGELPADQAAGVGLAIRIRRDGDRLAGTVRFRADRFRAETAARFARHYATLLGTLLADTAAPVGAAALMDDEEREAVLAAARVPAAAYPEAPIHALFAAQAAATPAAVAIDCGGERMTYAALDAAANRLAHHLRRRGAGPESRVGISLERGFDLYVAMLGILKAGAAFVPLDPAYPAERRAWMAADAGIAVVVARGADADGIAAPAVRLDADREAIGAEPETAPGVEVPPDAAAYVMYTSGSTGTPKGVAVPHRAVVRLVRETGFVALGPGETILQLAPVSFDASTFEIWGALLNGGTLAVFPPGTPSLEALARFLPAHGVTTLWLTAGLFHAMVDAHPGAFGGVRQLIAGGDVLSPAHVRRVLEACPGLVVVNGYGPTENTTFTACARIATPGEVGGAVPIGTPIAHTSVYVLDPAMRLVPVGVPGELYAGGAGLARGYVGRPGMTAERFVPSSFGGAGKRLYRTGDRVRWRGDGRIEFLGRADAQVKIRGFRVEPGEVEAVLRGAPGVHAAVVAVREDAPGDRRLVAYAVAGEGGDALNPAALKAFLAARLPDHLVPSAVVLLAAFPLTPNGKVDRDALPAPGAEGAGQVAPRTPTEEIVAGIWADLLRLPSVGVEDDFFVLGGHSLLATQVAARVREAFGVEVALRALFDAPTVADLAAGVDAALAGGHVAPPAPIAPVPRDAPLPLSFAQARLWFLDRMEPGSPAYHMPYALRLRGALDTGALEAAFTELVARHESLRTRFTDAGGQPVQVIDPAPGFRLPVVEVEGAGDPAREAEALRLAALEATRPFDLARRPLFRASLLRLGPEDHVLLATAHHIVADGWSMDVVVRELSALYDGFRRGAPPALPDLPVQYADYAVWQRERLAGDALDRQLAWWRERLDGAPPLLEIPTDRPRAAEAGARAGAHDFALSAEATRALRALGPREGATLFMVLLAGWQALLARYAGTHDVVVGTPVSGRTRVEVEGLVGFFVNTLALRTDLAGDPPFAALLARVRDTTLAAWQHQDLPFDRLVDALGVERSLAHTPVFQAMFSLERAGRGGSLALGDAAAEWFGGWGEGARFDLDLTLMERETRITGVLRYRAALFDPATAERMAARFTALLKAAAADASRPLSQLGAMDPVERARVLAAASVPAAPYPEATVHDLFSAQAAATPDATAILFGGARTTYAAVEARANRLAHHLHRRGVAADERVALCLERSPDLYVAMLGILKAGAAFVPLDLSYPPERLAAMVADAGARVLVTTTRLAAELPVPFPDVVRMDGGRDLDGEPETPPPPAGAPDSLAYVVFTSGSTGTPKGVAVPHRAVVRLVRETTYAEFGPGETILQLAPVSFDASTFEIWGALLNGGTLAVFPPGVPSLDEVACFVRERGVTTLWLTAGLFHPLADADPAAFRGVRQLVAGGDVLSPAHVRRVLEACPGLVVVNGYGPTENTTFTACARIAAPGEVAGAVPIGTPIAHTTAYVVDAALRPVPDGLPGELATGGAGLARGYVGRPALTAERFVPSPFGPAGARLYRTGDRVRRRLDGRLEFLGRADAQVKIRGFRVEPGEVESALRAHPGVREAVVTVHADAAGDRRLVAYTVAEPGAAAPSAATLREALAGRLPEYMLPAAYVALDALPVNANGKVDRRALPAPSWSGEDAYVAPRTPVEEVLVEIWAEVLGWADRGDGERVGVHDDFFVLGGHSLLATQVVARVQRAFGVKFPVRTVFEAPTVASLAERVEGALLGGLSDADLAAVEGMSEQELSRYLDALENEE